MWEQMSYVWDELLNDWFFYICKEVQNMLQKRLASYKPVEIIINSKVCKNSTQISRLLTLKRHTYMIAYRPDPTIPGAYVLTLVILVHNSRGLNIVVMKFFNG